MNDTKTFDTLAVNIETSTIRFFGQDKNLQSAEAIVKMAIMRRGLDEEFYVVVPHGMYKEGEKFNGGAV